MNGKETRLATETDFGTGAHRSVLLRETIHALEVRSGSIFLDGTIGCGGHAEQILERSSPHGLVIGLDWDEEALDFCAERLKRFGSRLILQRRSYAEASQVLQELGWDGLDGIVLDLGISSLQVSKPERGFSFLSEGPLDMRMDRRREVTAESLLQKLNVRQIVQIFRDFGQEPRAGPIARAIVRERSKNPFRTTAQLTHLVSLICSRRGKTHPATRIFQALRIAVNRELEELKRFLSDAYLLLRPSGVLAIVSFHSLEHRMVKHEFQKWEQHCLCPPSFPDCTCGWSRKAEMLFRKPIKPSREERQKNPRSRSAQLRAVRRIPSARNG
jgi:16S rRNA (cytosine1402-N4)-methyltransferase